MQSVCSDQYFKVTWNVHHIWEIKPLQPYTFAMYLYECIIQGHKLNLIQKWLFNKLEGVQDQNFIYANSQRHHYKYIALKKYIRFLKCLSSKLFLHCKS